MNEISEITAKKILCELKSAEPQPTSNAPEDCRGIYGLYDHLCKLRYIGATKSLNQSFYERIHERHRLGTGAGHKFSWYYNCGRMWNMPSDPATEMDGNVSKELRNGFIADYCKAVWVPLPDESDIFGFERKVRALVSAEEKAWNQCKLPVYEEPVELVDKTIDRLGFGEAECKAIERQKARYSAARS